MILSGVAATSCWGLPALLGGHYRAQLDRVPGPLRRAAIAPAGRPADRHSPVLNAMRLARGFLESASLPFDERYRSYVGVFPDAAVESLLRAPATDEHDALARALAQASSEDELNRMLAVDAATQLPDDLLMLTDRMSMAVSLECRAPLLDHELCEPRAHSRAHQAARRTVEARDEGGARRTLPDEILDRKKRGFGAPMGGWLKRDLAPVLRETLSPEALDRRGLFRSDAVKALDRRARREPRRRHRPAPGTLNFEIWARIYLDDRDPSDVTDELRAVAA